MQKIYMNASSSRELQIVDQTHRGHYDEHADNGDQTGSEAMQRKQDNEDHPG